MRNLIVLATMVLLVGCATGYRRPILGMGGGYSDRQVAEGRWEVTFGGNAYTQSDYVLSAALYRSAELAHAAGFPYFQVVKRSGVITQVSVSGPAWSPGGAAVYLTVRGVERPDAELKCENEDQTGCITLSTEAVLHDLEPVVRRRRAQMRNGGSVPGPSSPGAR